MAHPRFLFVFLVIAAGLCIACAGSAPRPELTPDAVPAASAEAPRNPFGVEDIADEHFRREIAQWTATLDRPGDPDDPNALLWTETLGVGDYDSIDGEWAGRWRFSNEPDVWHEGVATIRSIGDRVFIRYEDSEAYLIEAVREGDLLEGAYVNLGNREETGAWAGRVVGHDRIDGYWPIGARWDFRRSPPEID